MGIKSLKNIFYILFAVGIILTSCQKEEEEVPTGPEGIHQRGFLAMSVNSKTNTRAATTDVGTINENNITKAVLVLYNAATNKVAYQFILLPGTGLFPTANAVYLTEPVHVEVKAYKLAVFLNPSDSLLSLTKENHDLSELETAVNVSVTDLTGTNYDNFLMGNFAGLINIATTDIKETKIKAKQNPVPIYIERAVTKILMELDAGFASASPLVDVTSIRWQADVINKSAYWMRKQTKRLFDNTGTGALIPEEIGIDPSYRWLMYAESPGFSQTSAAYWDYQKNILGQNPGYDRPTPANQYNYISLSDINKKIDLKSEWVYVTENTMVAEEQWEDVTTSVIISAILNPKTTLFGENIPTGSSYFVFKNRVFSGIELSSIEDDSFRDANNRTWKEYEAINPALSGFQAFLQDPDTKTAFGSYMPQPTNPVEYGGLKFYSGGLNIYNIPIRHFSNDLQPELMTYGRFGVVRNNAHKLTLKFIKKFGDVNIPDRDNPDEAEKESWLSIGFDILPWVIRSQNIIL